MAYALRRYKIILLRRCLILMKKSDNRQFYIIYKLMF